MGDILSPTAKWIIQFEVRVYLQLKAEGSPEHLETLHLKIHSYGRFVVLVKHTLTEPRRGKEGETPTVSISGRQLLNHRKACWWSGKSW